MQTDPSQFVTDLDAGVFAEKLGTALSDVAAGVIDHGKPGRVSITFELKRIGDSYQVAIDHKLSYMKPTKRGKVMEENTTQTPMHVGRGGRLTLFPEDQVPRGQTHMFKGANSEPMPADGNSQ